VGTRESKIRPYPVGGTHPGTEGAGTGRYYRLRVLMGAALTLGIHGVPAHGYDRVRRRVPVRRLPSEGSLRTGGGREQVSRQEACGLPISVPRRAGRSPVSRRLQPAALLTHEQLRSHPNLSPAGARSGGAFNLGLLRLRHRVRAPLRATTGRRREGGNGCVSRAYSGCIARHRAGHVLVPMHLPLPYPY
jgi:hypothetical protein